MSTRPLTVYAAALAAILVVGAGAWIWQADWAFTTAEILSFLQRHVRDPAAPLVVALVYIVAGFALVPVMALIAVTGLAFGPVVGALYALLGAVASGVCSYAIGRCFGTALAGRWSGPRIEAIRAQLQARGLIAMIIVRVVPSGPYTLVNLVAGASGIRARDFVLGTLLGMTPGVIVTVGLVHGVRAAWLLRNAYTAAAVFIAAAAVGLLGHLVRRALSRRRDGTHATKTPESSLPERRR
jgi:phospholipase D1/2